MRVGLDDAERLVEIRRVPVLVIILAAVAPVPFLPVALPSSRSPCPPRPRRPASPAADSAQSGLASAIRRRVRSTAWARVSSWVGARISMWASWRTRSSRWTSSPSSHRQAAASVKWVRATQPSRIGLLASRSSRRAERILGGGERAGELGPRQRIGDLVAGLQGLDNLNRNRPNGS